MILAIGYLFVAALSRAFLGDIFELLFLLAAGVPVGIFIVGCCLLLNSASVWQTSRAAALAGTAIILTGGWIHFLGGQDLATKGRFWCVQSRYEAKLAKILATHAAGGNITSLGIDDLAGIENGPPVRVAFYWNRGVIDNWVGLIYDPSGEVMRANEYRGGPSNAHTEKVMEMVMLFDGDLIRARHLSGHWYLCSFT